MDHNDRGTLRTATSVGVLLAVLGIAIAAGFVVANDGPTGADVLTDVEDRYESADSVVVHANVTAEHDGTTNEYTVSTVTADSERMRVNVSNATEYAVFGHAENTSWVAGSTTEAPIVVRNGTVVGQSALSGGTNASALSDARSEWDREWDHEHGGVTPKNLSVSTLLEETNATAEFVETTTVDGETVHVVELSSPERDGRLTLWATTDTATVLKYRTTTPNGTMTVDVEETHFDVSPAESTFQPPGDDSWRTSVDSIEEVQASADGPIAVPDETWSFETGTVLASPVPAVASQYTANGSNLTLVQSNASAFSEAPDPDDGRTVEVGNRTVTITDGHGETTVARWSSGDLTVIAIGDRSESALLDVVAGTEIVASSD
jgi:outer membrane lipoprotein-sorting protein